MKRWQLNNDGPFVKTKLMVGDDDVLVILYLHEHAIVDQTLLQELVDTCGTTPWVPHNATVAKPHCVWIAEANTAGALSYPVV